MIALLILIVFVYITGALSMFYYLSQEYYETVPEYLRRKEDKPRTVRRSGGLIFLYSVIWPFVLLVSSINEFVEWLGRNARKGDWNIESIAKKINRGK